MNNQKILIITHSHDNEGVNKVMDCIHASGATAIRFNTDCYPLSLQLSTIYTNNQWTILFDDGTTMHNLHDVTAVWYRRSYNLGNGLKQVIQPEFLSPALTEAKRTLFGMLEGLNCFHMERFSTYRRLDSKEEQLKVAVQNGLLIPDTCISNDPERVKQFLQQQTGPVITKMQHSFAIYKGKKEQVVFTNEIEPGSYDELGSLQYCPMVFQQRIEKKLELRVTIVGEKVFAFAIDSQQNKNAQVDWRKEGDTLLHHWQPYELPATIQQQLLSFMNSYNINYGAIDLILTPGNKYYFLELNAAGEYFWLDVLCDFSISKQIADVLMGKAKRQDSLRSSLPLR